MSNTKTTKRGLFTSVFAMLLCVAMFVGATFAWFTDSVTSGNNQIVAGNLDVELYHSATDTPSKTDGNKVTETTPLFKMNLWEPGAVVYENFLIANEGTLALEYVLDLNLIDVNYVVEKNGDTPTVTGRSLADVLYVKIDNGSVTGNRPDYSAEDGVQLKQFLATPELRIVSGALEAGGSKNVSVVVYWPSSANDNQYNLKNGWYSASAANSTTDDGRNTLYMKLAIVLNARQYSSENDSFGNSYDNGAMYPGDVQVEDQAWNELDAVTTDTVIDGGGRTYAATYQEVALVGNANITIKGVAFQNGLTVYTAHDANGTIRLENCTIYLNNGSGNPSNSSMTQNRADYGLIIGAVSPNVTWELVNCKFTAYDNHRFTGTNSYNACILGNYSAESISFDGCTFEGAGRHGIGCSYAPGPNQATIPFTYYNLKVTGCNFVNWNNFNPNNNGAAIRGNVPADVLTQFSKSINISGNTFGENNGSTQHTVAIDGWSGSWN